MKFAGLALKLWLLSISVPHKIRIDSGKKRFRSKFLQLVFVNFSCRNLPTILSRVVGCANCVAIRVKRSEYGTVSLLAVVAQHSSTLNWNDFGLTSPK